MMNKVLYTILVSLLFVAVADAQLNTTLIGQLPYDDAMSNVWGWTSDDGEEYVIAGTYDGTSLVDITDPSDPNEVQFINGSNSTWRQIGVWSDYAYIVNESGGGLLCVDMSGLPVSGTADFNFTDCGIGLTTGHILYCDEDGRIYIFGSNLYGGSTVMLDATVDPMNPSFVGATDEWYVHHGFARNDTLWESNIYQGWFSAWDVSDPGSPELLGTQETPGVFTHNVVVMENGIHLFSTDEVTNGSLGAYDVSDITDIQYLGEYRPTPGSNSIPHYTWNLDPFLTTAWYRDGLVVTDNSHPEATVMTAWYDTSPMSGNGFNGAWGVYPYFPSGIVAVTDIEEGLFLIGVDYIEACFLDGVVTDASTSAPIFGASIVLSDPTGSTTSNLSGGYVTGLAAAGTYEATYSKPGYETKVITGIVLENGETVSMDVELEPLVSFPFIGQVIDVVSGDGIADADVLVKNAAISFSTVTDVDGNFTVPSVFEDTYSVYAGKWGFVTNAEIDVLIDGTSSLVVELDRGYYDDYLFDFDWTSTSTASSGDWVKADPIGTDFGASLASPENDVNDDFGLECYTTGNGGGSSGTDDVDDGIVTLTSPVFDLTDYANAYISFDFWFFNNGGSGTPNDTLKMSISNGITTVLMDEKHGTTVVGFWQPRLFKISDYITPTADMKAIFSTEDKSASGHVLEAAIDKFYVFDSVTTAPTAAFNATSASGCETSSISFHDMSVGATSWLWSFPGGTPASSTLANPVITYNTVGIYDVSLTATNALGSNTITIADYITIMESPVATTSVGAGSATVSVSGGALPYTFLWSDGQTTETASGLAVGSYTVTVTDANGCTVDATAVVTQPSGIEILADGYSLELFPNPVADQLNLVFDAINPAVQATVEMVDMSGRLVNTWSLSSGTNQIEVIELPAGLYMLKVKADGVVVAQTTIVKQ